MAEGEFALVSEHMETARQRPGQPVKRGTMAHDHETYLMLVDSAVQKHDQEGIQKYATRLKELAKRDDHKLYLAIAQRALGVGHRLSNQYDEAETCLTEALELFEQLGARWQKGRTLVEMAELELVRENRTQAHRYLSDALTDFEAMKALPNVEQTQSALGVLTDAISDQGKATEAL